MNHPASRFSYSPVPHTYAAEASELGWKPGTYPAYLTMDGYVFEFASTKYSPNGDVFAWVYTPHAKAVALLPALTGAKILVFND